MDRYTIYCTEEQTRKALELGAPLVTIEEPLYNHPACGRDWVKVKVQGKSCSARIPTAEQMIGWLEEQGIKINIEHSNVEDSMRFKIHKSEDFDYEIAWNFHYSSRKEATLAAIDAALDYLMKKEE